MYSYEKPFFSENAIKPEKLDSYFIYVGLGHGKLLHVVNRTRYKNILQKLSFMADEKAEAKKSLGLSRRMLKQPGFKSSGLYVLVFQDRPDRGRKNMFANMFEKSSKIRKKVENDTFNSMATSISL